MQKWLKFNEWRRIWVHRTSNIEIQKGRQNNSDILQNWLPLEIRFPFFNLQKFLDPQKSTPDSCTNEWSRIWIYKTFEIEIKKRGPNNADILQNWFPPEIRSPLYNLPKLQDYDSWFMQKWLKSNEWGRIWVHITFMIEIQKEGDQIIQTFCKIGSPQKLGPPSLIWKNFRTLRKVLLIHAEMTEI